MSFEFQKPKGTQLREGSSNLCGSPEAGAELLIICHHEGEQGLSCSQLGEETVRENFLDKMLSKPTISSGW
jgi:hypothetical protein